jgi:phenylpyruvate tautomerase PptA (4-oxalocrotonate tautomerase family)
MPAESAPISPVKSDSSLPDPAELFSHANESSHLEQSILDQQQLRIAVEEVKHEQWSSLSTCGLTDAQIETLQEHPKNVAFLLEKVMLGNIVSYKAC